jgi:protein AATF/BFR2
MKEAAGQQVKKEVDRKASKNRKIRYVIHDKIVNFLVPLENLTLFEGREAIVSNLFGVHQTQSIVSRKVRKEDDVQLL